MSVFLHNATDIFFNSTYPRILALSVIKDRVDFKLMSGYKEKTIFDSVYLYGSVMCYEGYDFTKEIVEDINLRRLNIVEVEYKHYDLEGIERIFVFKQVILSTEQMNMLYGIIKNEIKNRLERKT